MTIIRPRHVTPVPLADLAALSGATLSGPAARDQANATPVHGITQDSRAVQPGDLYMALPGARSHGATFAQAAVAAGAVAVLTDDDGARLCAAAAPGAGTAGLGVPVLTVPAPRSVMGMLAARIYSTGRPGSAMPLFAVTGTNGKTTTTYFLNSLLRALGRTTGLIGTIEILAGENPLPSKLTTPESPEVHAFLAIMAERGLGAASMEVSSHALEFGRVDGVHFAVAGFTNLTQDHLDLHGGMEEYFATKAQLFTPERTDRAVILVDDEWGRRLAATTTVPAVTVSTAEGPSADWQVLPGTPEGPGIRFALRGPGALQLSVHSGLPGDFNVANAALATVMVIEQLHGTPGATLAGAAATVQDALDRSAPFSVDVPGRMQQVGAEPTAIVDFAHNPDALARALTAVRPADPKGKLIVVFGATGERDQTKRPLMGAVAAAGADVVIITDDDPHNEDPATIRAGVLAGARDAVREAPGGSRRGARIEEVGDRAAAIRRAVALAGPADTLLVAGRGHEVHQEVQGVNVALDDRVELRRALAEAGFPTITGSGIE